jgi:hypothetical protein
MINARHAVGSGQFLTPWRSRRTPWYALVLSGLCSATAMADQLSGTWKKSSMSTGQCWSRSAAAGPIRCWSGDRLLVVYLSRDFYSYVRAPVPGPATGVSGHTSTGRYKPTLGAGAAEKKVTCPVILQP